ncbi:MAG: nicotinate-nucleotide adenylyltransferase [Burkholderiales bacterium]
MRTIGIVGGTFDPIHYGHLRLAEEARRHFKLTEIRFIPVAVPPHRGTPTASLTDRTAMVNLAIQNNSFFALDGREAKRPGKSYTVETLSELRAEHPQTALLLIMGSDAFAGLTAWMRWRELFALCHVIVGQRPGFSFDGPDELRAELEKRFTKELDSLQGKPDGAIASFVMTPLDISASRIRQMIARGQSPRYLLPDSVLDYIQSHSLYRTEPDES